MEGVGRLVVHLVIPLSLQPLTNDACIGSVLICKMRCSGAEDVEMCLWRDVVSLKVGGRQARNCRRQGLLISLFNFLLEPSPP